MATAHDVARCIRELLPGAGRVKVQKLLYYSQGIHLAVTGVPLFQEAIEAWEFGPVVRDVYRADRYGDAGPAVGRLDHREEVSVRTAVSRYGSLTARELVTLTHAEGPWTDAIRLGHNTIIAVDDIRGFFVGHRLLKWDEDEDEPAELTAVVDDEYAELVNLALSDIA